MAKKLLVVGIGSQGIEICRRVSQKVIGEYRSLDRAPWIELIGFDTAPTPANRLGKPDSVYHMRLDGVQIQNIRRSAGTPVDRIGTKEWADWDILGTTTSILSGANNVRMAGRLVFLAGKNYAEFENRVGNALRNLNNLTEIQAQAARGRLRDGTNPLIQFEEGIHVVVCGALTGGTGSGSFIDVGYVIQNIPGFAGRLAVDGIWGIPNAAVTTAQLWGNAYAALTEAEHFQRNRSRFQARYESQILGDHGSLDLRSTEPYRRIYLTQPKGSGDAKRVEMNNSLAEYLYLLGMEPTAGQIEAEATNAYGIYSNQLDLSNRGLKFSSLGVSVIVFPVEYIIEGCASRVIVEALEPWLRPKTIEKARLDQYTRDFGMDTASIKDAVEKSDVAKAVWEQLQSELDAAIRSQINGDGSAIPSVTSNLRRKIKIDIEQGVGQLSGEYYEKVAQAGINVSKRIDEALKRYLEAALMDVKQGPRSLQTVFEHCLAKVRARLNEIQNPAYWTRIKATFEQEISGFENTSPAPPPPQERKGCNPFARKPQPLPQPSTNSQAELQASSLLNSLKIITLAPIEQRALLEAEKTLKRFILRLDDTRFGLLQWADALEAKYNTLLQERTSIRPVINGEVLMSNETVDTEYRKALPEQVQQDAAHQRALAAVRQYAADLLSPIGQCSFELEYFQDGDVKRELLDEEWGNILDVIKPLFEDIRSETAIDRLVSEHNANWKVIVRSAIEKATAFADVRDWGGHPGGHPQDDNAGHLSKTFAFIPNGDDLDRQPPRSKTRQLSEAITEVRTHRFGNAGDVHSIVFMQALYTFAAEAVDGVAATGRNSFKPAHHARTNISWRRLDGRPADQNFHYRCGLILTAMSLGVLTWLQPNRMLMTTTALPGRPSRQESLPGIIEDAAAMLMEKELATDLETQVTKEIMRVGYPEAAKKAENFTQNLGAFGFEYEGEPLNGESAFSAMSHLVSTLPDFRKAWIDIFPYLETWTAAVDLAEGANVTIAGKSLTVAAGRYCPHCYTRLANAGAPNDTLPRFCRNDACSWLIRY